MAIVKLPYFHIYDEQGGQAETATVMEYQVKILAWQHFAELSQFLIEKTYGEEGLPFDVEFRASIFAGRGLAFIYRSPWVRKQSLPYQQQSGYDQEPRSHLLEPGYALTLDQVTVCFNDRDAPPIEANGRLGNDCVTVTFDDSHNLATYLDLNKDPSQVTSAVDV